MRLEKATKWVLLVALAVVAASAPATAQGWFKDLDDVKDVERLASEPLCFLIFPGFESRDREIVERRRRALGRELDGGGAIVCLADQIEILFGLEDESQPLEYD